MPVTKSSESPFAYEGLDRVLHERARLSIMASLSSHKKGLSFADLKKLCDLSDGNLSRHLQVLEENDYLKIEKGYEGKRPHTSCKLTAKGAKAFAKYIDVLEKVVRDAAQQTKNATKPTQN